MTAFDVEHQVASKARTSWNEIVSMNPASWLASVTNLLQQAILAPTSLYTTLIPPAAEAAPPPKFGGGKKGPPPGAQKKVIEERPRAEVEEEEEGDRNARYRTGAIGVLKWLLGVLMYMINRVMLTFTRRHSSD